MLNDVAKLDKVISMSCSSQQKLGGIHDENGEISQSPKQRVYC